MIPEHDCSPEVQDSWRAFRLFLPGLQRRNSLGSQGAGIAAKREAWGKAGGERRQAEVDNEHL